MTEETCDVAIIGAGTAGLAAERAARAEGATTRLIDDKFAGTVCATVGCMPSKLLIAAAGAAHGARRTSVFGVSTGEVTVDGKAVMRRVRAERDKFVAATLSGIDDLPDGTCVRSTARFLGPTRIGLAGGDTLSAKAIVIATGASPFIPEAFEALGDLVLTNRTIFEIEDLPRTLAVVGGGAIGIEIAQAMARLGVETTLFDEGTTLGGARDDDVRKAVIEVMAGELTVTLGITLKAQRVGDQARLSWTGKSEGSQTFDKVLVATGRPPQLGALALENAGLVLDDHGVPTFDRTTLQCGDAPVFIAGDANGDVAVLHEASDEGAIAGRNAALYPDVTPASRYPRLTITFTDPPLASVGPAPGDDSAVGCAAYDDQGRAKVEARAKGLARLYASKSDGRLTGAEIFAPGADHLAHLLAWAIKSGETAATLLEMPFYHPTLEEGLRPALRSLCKSVSLALPTDRDAGDPPGK